MSSAAALQGCVLLRGRGAPLEQLHALAIDAVDLRTAIEQQVQGPGAAGTGAELVVDVADVGAADHGDVHPVRTRLLDQLSHAGGVGTAIGDRGAVPVEDRRLKPAP